MRTVKRFDKIAGSDFEQRSVGDAGPAGVRRREALNNPCSPAIKNKGLARTLSLLCFYGTLVGQLARKMMNLLSPRVVSCLLKVDSLYFNHDQMRSGVVLIDGGDKGLGKPQAFFFFWVQKKIIILLHQSKNI
jgi:hypothetical protein